LLRAFAFRFHVHLLRLIAGAGSIIRQSVGLSSVISYRSSANRVLGVPFI
jgi:hypothetical protein